MIVFKIKSLFAIVAASLNSEFYKFIIRDEEYTLTRDEMRNLRIAINLLDLERKTNATN